MNQLLRTGKGNFDPEKLTGIWQNETGDEIFEITPENTVIVHLLEGIKPYQQGVVPELPFTTFDETEKKASMKIALWGEETEAELMITDEDHILFDGRSFSRITKSDLENILARLAETESFYHDPDIPPGVKDLASEILYEYIYVPYGVEVRSDPSFTSEVIGTFQEDGYHFVVDVFIDSQQVIWAEIEVPFDEIPDYYWIIYQ